MSDQNHMPEVNFDKDKVHKYIIEQIKLVEKDNRRRVKLFNTRLFNGRKSLLFFGSLVVSIYGYTMHSVSRETFLDNFDDPDADD